MSWNRHICGISSTTKEQFLYCSSTTLNNSSLSVSCRCCFLQLFFCNSFELDALSVFDSDCCLRRFVLLDTFVSVTFSICSCIADSVSDQSSCKARLASSSFRTVFGGGMEGPMIGTEFFFLFGFFCRPVQFLRWPPFVQSVR